MCGDAAADGPARLLNYDVDKWVHLNCALWSEEVYETVSGALVNVETALKNGANTFCKDCEQNYATVKCFKTRCTYRYHLNCAVKDKCTFYKDKTVFCNQHQPKGEKDNELTTLAVYRRVYIERDENRQVNIFNFTYIKLWLVVHPGAQPKSFVSTCIYVFPILKYKLQLFDFCFKYIYIFSSNNIQ